MLTSTHDNFKRFPNTFLGKSLSLAVEAQTIFFKCEGPQEPHNLNRVKFILLWCLSGARAPPF